MKNVVKQMLLDLGVNPANKGFNELAKAILMVVDKGEPMMMKEIYQSIYPEGEVKYCSFDRNCRWAIENTYLADTDMYKHLFGQTEKCPNLKFFIHASYMFGRMANATASRMTMLLKISGMLKFMI